MRTKRTLYNIISSLLLQLTTIVYGFIVPKIIISKFGSDVNGLVSSITQFLAYITLLESGFGPVIKAALYKPIANKDTDAIASILKTSEKFFRKIAFIFVVYIISLFFIYPQIIDRSFDTLFTISLIAIIGISTFTEYFFGITYRIYLHAAQKSYVVSIIQTVTYILSTITIAILAITGADILVIKLISGLIFVLRPFCQIVYIKKRNNISIKNVPNNYKIKQKWDGLAQHVATVIHGNTDITVLTIFRSLMEVSVYSVYNLIVKALRSLFFALVDNTEALFGDMIAKNEKRNLIKKFSIYESLYLCICTPVFTSTILLITPFIMVYTQGINDANYIQPIFGSLIVISEYIWAIRQPYNGLIKAAGHFKQTRKGAWIECITNIIVSVILVNWLGIIGVAIGTIIAVSIRAIEFIYYANNKILERSMWESVKKISLVATETIIIIAISNYLPYEDNDSYLNWAINAIMVAAVSTIIATLVNLIVYRKDIKQFRSLIKNIKKEGRRKNDI